MTPGFRSALAGSPALLLLLVLLWPSALAAQVRDTAAIDTLAADTVPKDTIPPPPFVPLHTGLVRSYGAGIWHWDRTELLRARAVSLAHLLAQIPGVTVLRTGLYLQPEAASAFGSTAGGLIVELDGYVLDPLAAPVLDLSRIPLVEIEQVNVTRRVDGRLHVRVRTSEAFDARAYSRVEAATGQPDANVFRGLLLAPHFLFGPLGVAVERVDTEGLGAAQPADDFSAWVKWGVTRENRGVQVEFRQISLQRDPSSPWISDYSRRDVVVRARNRFLPGLVGELYAGFAALELEGPAPVQPPGTEPPPAQPIDRAIERSAFQSGARLGLVLPAGFVEGAVRVRDRDDLPSTEGSVEAAFSALGDRIGIHGRFETARWGEGSATSLDAGASFAPLPWFRLFGEWADGTHGAPPYGRTADGAPILTDRSGYRVGGELAWRGISAGGALVSASTDSVPAFGLPFDSAYSRFAGGEVRGVEFQGRIPLFVDWLAAEGSFLRWLEGTRWAYVPSVAWTAALEAHVLPLASGNLEVLLRGEAVHRGDTPVPDPAGPGEEAPLLTTAPPRTLLNVDLVLRILDVQAFLRYEDTSNQDPFDLPGHVINGPRILYGVKWHFWN
jgi:hypothetical protein